MDLDFREGAQLRMRTEDQIDARGVIVGRDFTLCKIVGAWKCLFPDAHDAIPPIWLRRRLRVIAHRR